MLHFFFKNRDSIKQIAYILYLTTIKNSLLLLTVLQHKLQGHTFIKRLHIVANLLTDIVPT